MIPFPLLLESGDHLCTGVPFIPCRSIHPCIPVPFHKGTHTLRPFQRLMAHDPDPIMQPLHIRALPILDTLPLTDAAYLYLAQAAKRVERTY